MPVSVSNISIAFRNGTSSGDFPTGSFKPASGGLTITINGGTQAEFGGAIADPDDWEYGNPTAFQAEATAWVNGSHAADLILNSTTGVLSGPVVNVNPGDEVELRLEAPKQISTNSWGTVKTTARSTYTMTVGNDGTTTFNAPDISAWTMKFGYDGGSGDFKVTTKYSTGGGVTASAAVRTGLPGSPGYKTSSSMSPTSTAPQTHTAAFDKATAEGGTGEVEVVIVQPWGSGQRYVQGFLFRADELPAYPTGNLPGAADLTQTESPTGRAQIDD